MGGCQTEKFSVAVPYGGVIGYNSVAPSKSAMHSALQLGPVSVAIEADRLQGYKSGVIGDCGTDSNHGVTVVGYEHEGNYWIVKNSWGTSWGMNGYAYIDATWNACGIHNHVSYPTVRSAVQV